MRAWPRPHLPAVVGDGVPLRLHDAASGQVRPVEIAGDRARLYVCGVTPYDTTHLGHAATYVTFDVVHRALLDAGHEVEYVQNVTDIDDPLLERAARDGVDWQALAEGQITLFRDDMTALAVLPPHHYVGVVESVDAVRDAVLGLAERGLVYELAGESGARDHYLDLAAAGGTGRVAHLDGATMLALSAERGGDPDRPGKRGPLDPLLWRGHRDGEPSWDGGPLGSGRPGWHIECTAIALQHLGPQLDVQGGGSDLEFPHHEMSVVQAEALTGVRPFAGHTTYQGMVGYQGEKMSKSRGNLVRVSTLRDEGVDPMVVRLALLGHHYRTDWEWTDAELPAAQERFERWRAAMSRDGAPDAHDTMAAVRAAVADDLDTPGAIAAVDAWCERSLDRGGVERVAPGELARLLDALLGVRL